MHLILRSVNRLNVITIMLLSWIRFWNWIWVQTVTFFFFFFLNEYNMPFSPPSNWTNRPRTRISIQRQHPLIPETQTDMDRTWTVHVRFSASPRNSKWEFEMPCPSKGYRHYHLSITTTINRKLLWHFRYCRPWFFFYLLLEKYISTEVATKPRRVSQISRRRARSK